MTAADQLQRILDELGRLRSALRLKDQLDRIEAQIADIAELFAGDASQIAADLRSQVNELRQDDQNTETLLKG